MNAIVPHVQANVESYRASTDAAALCKEIVVNTAMDIQGRKYVKVEGWQAIAIAHGCACSAKDVERVEGGVRATGEVRRMSDGALIATAEGFVGEDEAVWFGGTVTDKWGKTKTHAKRPDYGIRAMAQTRAISRACRSAFAHVVVMMNAGLQTTPAEEVPVGGFDNGDVIDQGPPPSPRETKEARKVLNPKTGRMVDPMSANQARQDGRGERYDALKHEITDLAAVTDCIAWAEEHKAEIGKLPTNWQDDLRSDLALQIRELRAEAEAASAEEPEPIGYDAKGNPIHDDESEWVGKVQSAFPGSSIVRGSELVGA